MSSNWISRVLVSLALLVLPCLATATRETNPPPAVPSVGDKAPEFSLKDFSGKRFVLSESAGRGAVVLWFTNLCAGCRSKFAEVERLKREYDGKGVEVIALSQLGKDRKTVEEAIRAHRLTVRFLYDPKGEVTTRYAGRYVPGTCPLKNLYLVDKAGTIVFATHYPGVPEEEIEERLSKLSAAEQGSR